ncbi:MAG: tRNA 2-thiouridine(34) synthase MnmA [Actinobacteria bacterium]|jgi:tRNA-specific 2-thiouridylase|nr:tRNA 2-thiouridine(34) synthase MnmA [Actinomycetota bacterium]MCL6094990.1 tRNA 2-thiouridine(34) synthase MnmA [Actinomycetota bacterium]
MSRVLVAMSGGVDSSVAAALLVRSGYDVTGVTMKLWDGVSDRGCCSVRDVEDARRVARRLGIDHYVFNFTEEFENTVVLPYVTEHTLGRTPNPCIDCNRHLKFGKLLERARQLGFDKVATGHYARVIESSPSRFSLYRGVDQEKDQSYVLSVLTQSQLAYCLFPLGDMTKSQARDIASTLGLCTANKPDSQDVCFITDQEGREGFLSRRMDLHPGEVVEVATGRRLGNVPALELITVGQRKGIVKGADGKRRYVLRVDIPARQVLVGQADEVGVSRIDLTSLSFVEEPVPPGTEVLVQVSAHGFVTKGCFLGDSVVFEGRHRRVAPGQTVALYDGSRVLGAGLAKSSP